MPDPTANHTAMRDDIGEHAAHHVDRDREADAFHAEVLGDDRGVDADEGAARIDERPARVAKVDGRIRLDEVLQGRDAELLAARCADDAVRHRLRQPDGIADREHDVAYFELVGAPEGGDGQRAEINLENGQVRVRIAPDDMRVGDPAVGELHSDRVGVRDDVMVRDDMTALVDDHPPIPGCARCAACTAARNPQTALRARTARPARSPGGRYRTFTTAGAAR